MKKFTFFLASLFITIGAMAQINYGNKTWTFPATSHAKVSEVPAEIFEDFLAVENYGSTELTNEKVGVYTTEVRVNTEGDVTATFQYNGGDIRMDISGIDIIDSEGNIAKSDYHFGYTGGNSSNNTYTLTGVAVGDYTLRIFVAAQREDLTTKTSNGKITLNGAWLYPNTSTTDAKNFYYIKNVRSNKYATNKGEGKQFAQESSIGAGSYWYFVEAGIEDMSGVTEIPEGFKAYWVYSAANVLPVENVTSGRFAAVDAASYPGKIYYIGVHTKDNSTGLVIKPYNEDGASWNDANGNGALIGHWNSDDAGSLWSIEVPYTTVSDLTAMGATAKNNAVTTVKNSKNAYYCNITDEQVNEAITNIGNINTSTMEASLTCVIEGTADAIANELLLNSSTADPAAGDRFIMKNHGREGYLRAYAEGDVKCSTLPNDVFGLDLVWTLVEADGGFKLYNERQGVYVGTLATGNNTKMSYTSDENSAGIYEISQSGIYTLFHAKGQDGYGYMHLSNWGGKEIVRWDNSDASQWLLFKAPFELTTDAETPICYAIKSGRDGNYYFTLESNKVKLYNNKDIATDETTHWFFMLDENKNLKIYPATDKENPMGYITIGNGPGKLTNNKAAEGFVADTYTLYFNDNKAADYNNTYFAFRPTEGDNFVSNHGGTGNYMGFYNEYNDHGTRVAFECVSGIELQKKIEAWEQYLQHEGDKVCQYTIAEDTKTAVTEAKAIVSLKQSNNANYTAALTNINAFEFPTINLPVANNYYRIKVPNTEKYIQGIASNVVNKTNTLLINEEKGAASIFYFGDNQLLSYTAGKYVKENGDARGLMSVGTAGGEATFEEGSAIGTIAVKVPSYMHTNESNGITFVDHCGGTGHDAHNYIIEEVTELPVTITAAGYATFYAPVDVTYEGIEAYYTTGDVQDKKYLILADFEGTIPATDGAILKGDEGTYNLTISSGAEKKAGNKLTGTIATTVITKVGTNSYYVLGRDTNSNVGLYNPINGENTDVFTNTGHKAYMLMEGAAQTIGYSLGFDWGGTTGIENIEDAVEENATKAIYDITGRQIKAITVPGIYIINGKKTFVK